MHKLKALTTAFLLFLVASCSLPDENPTKKVMERYWQFCKNEQYDSLRSFYMAGSLPEAQLSQLFKGMHDAREKYGNIKQVDNFFVGAGRTFSEGETIELKYQVSYGSANIQHQFKYKKGNDDEFRIVEHNLLP